MPLDQGPLLAREFFLREDRGPPIGPVLYLRRELRAMLQGHRSADIEGIIGGGSGGGNGCGNGNGSGSGGGSGSGSGRRNRRGRWFPETWPDRRRDLQRPFPKRRRR